MLGSVRDKYRSAFRLPLHPGPWRNLLLEGLQEKISTPLPGRFHCLCELIKSWLAENRSFTLPYGRVTRTYGKIHHARKKYTLAGKKALFSMFFFACSLELHEMARVIPLC